VKLLKTTEGNKTDYRNSAPPELALLLEKEEVSMLIFDGKIVL
jgi:hypothetical protein